MTDVKMGARITRWLESSPRFVLVSYAIAVSFAVYFCMYAFRKPFSAAEYLGEDGKPLKFWGLDLKTVFVLSQIIGYMISKYVGIRICPEVKRRQRVVYLVTLIIVAEIALFFFAALPTNGLKVAAIFLNGIPLGMIWGLVVWYLEGRQTSELLLAGLSCSFIVASGVVKTVGLRLKDDIGVGEYWMPFVTGLLFLGPFLLFVWLLDRVPDPTEGDVEARVEREPMTVGERVRFLVKFLPGLALLFVAYFFLTAFRDFRDSYAVEIFRGLGYEGKPDIFTTSEMIVAVGVLIPLALLVLVKNNRVGLLGAYAIMITGVAMVGVSTLLLDADAISGFVWMTAVGLGSYLAYVPYGSVLFDRLIASTRVVGTAVFAIYVADALGYTGSVSLQLYRDLYHSETSRLEFFKGFSYFMSVLGVVLLVVSAVYFMRKTAESESEPESESDLGSPSSDP